jgi:hypothetical protein
MYPGTRPILRWTKGREGIEAWGIGDGFDIEGRNYEERNINSSLRGYSLGSRDLQGKRGDTFIDDVERQEEAESQAYRKQLKIRIEAIFRTLEDKIDATWVIVGTAFHSDSIYDYVCRQLEGLDRPFERIVRPYRNPDGTLLWPERADKIETHRRLMSKTAWNAAYELTPVRGRSLTPAEVEERVRDKTMPFIDNQKQFWDLMLEHARSHCPPWRTLAEWQAEIEARLRQGLMFYIGYDPATVGDWAIVVIACWGEEVYLLRCRLGVGDTWEQLVYLRDCYVAFPQSQIMIETNAQQKAFKDLIQQDDMLQYAQVVGEHTGRNKDDSQVGLPALLDKIHAGNLHCSWLNQDRAHEEFNDFEEELLHYGPTAHPHILPAIWFGWRWHRMHVAMTGIRRKIAERELIRKTGAVQIRTAIPTGKILAPQSDWLRQRTRQAWKRRA